MAVSWTNTGSIGMATKFGARATGGSADKGGGSGAIFSPTGANSPGAVGVLIGILVLWVLLKIVGESPKTSIEPAHISLGAYNVGTILLVTVGGLAVIKLILNLWQIPYATDLINFV